MIELLKLIRLKNIAFSAFVMYAMRYFVEYPLLAREGFSLQMSDGEFFLLAMSVCCLVSAAYVVNDYFDTKADRISGSRGVIVGKTVTRRRAIVLHSVLNVISVAIAFYLGWQVHCWILGFVFLAVSVLLWYHASHYKRCFVWGNLIVAFLAALIPLAVVLFELPLLQAVYEDIADTRLDTGVSAMVGCVLAHASFLFLNMLVYEMNKDIFSVEGDRDNGAMTFPVRIGIPATRKIMTTLVALCCVALLSFYFIVFCPSLPVALYFLLIIFYYGFYLWLLYKRKMDRRMQLNHFRVIMLLVVCLSFFSYYV